MLGLVEFQKRRFKHNRLGRRFHSNKGKLVIRAVPDERQEPEVGPLRRSRREVLPDAVLQAVLVRPFAEIKNIRDPLSSREIPTTSDRIDTRLARERRKERSLADFGKRHPSAETMRSEVGASHETELIMINSGLGSRRK